MKWNTKPHTLVEELGYLVPLLLAGEVVALLVATREFTRMLLDYGVLSTGIMRWLIELSWHDWSFGVLPGGIIAGYVLHYQLTTQRKIVALLWLVIGHMLFAAWSLMMVFQRVNLISSMSGT